MWTVATNDKEDTEDKGREKKEEWTKKKHNENEAITEINKDTMKTKRDGMCNQFYLPILFLLDTFFATFHSLTKRWKLQQRKQNMWNV